MFKCLGFASSSHRSRAGDRAPGEDDAGWPRVMAAGVGRWVLGRSPHQAVFSARLPPKVRDSYKVEDKAMCPSMCVFVCLFLDMKSRALGERISAIRKCRL